MRRNKRNYKTYKWYESEALTLLLDEETYQRYQQVKEKFNLGTTTTKKLLEKGVSKRDINKYWKREYDIITGKYEDNRNKLFIENYISGLNRAGVSKELIDKIEELSKGSRKRRQYLSYHLPSMPLWGYVNVKDDRNKPSYIKPSEQQIIENVKTIKELLNRIENEGIHREIDINKVKR